MKKQTEDKLRLCTLCIKNETRRNILIEERLVMKEHELTILTSEYEAKSLRLKMDIEQLQKAQEASLTYLKNKNQEFEELENQIID